MSSPPRRIPAVQTKMKCGMPMLTGQRLTRPIHEGCDIAARGPADNRILLALANLRVPKKDFAYASNNSCLVQTLPCSLDFCPGRRHRFLQSRLGRNGGVSPRRSQRGVVLRLSANGAE